MCVFKCLKLNTGRDNCKPITYDTHLKQVKDCLASVGLNSKSKTHMGRGSSIRMAESGGCLDLRSQGRWSKGAMEGCYTSNLPRQAMRVLAGFHRDGGRYFIERAVLPVPKELREKIFPEVEDCKKYLADNVAAICAESFVTLCDYLRDVLIQDVCILQDQFKHEVFEQPIWQSTEFLTYKKQLMEAIKNAVNPVKTELSVVVPDLITYLNETQLPTIQKASMGVDRIEQQLNIVTKNITAVERDIKKLKTYVNGIGTAFSGIHMEKSSEEERDTDTKEGEKNNDETDDGQKSNLFEFAMSSAVTSVGRLWDEFKIGINGKPAVEEVERSIGTAWRKCDSKKQWFLRRRKIIKKVEELSNEFGKEKAIELLEEFRGVNSLNWLSKNVAKWNPENVKTPSRHLKSTKDKCSAPIDASNDDTTPSNDTAPIDANDTAPIDVNGITTTTYVNGYCGKFRIISTVSDGDCFYDSLSKSKHVECGSREDIRALMQKYMWEQEHEAKILWEFVVNEGDGAFEKHRRLQKNKGRWARTYDIYIACVCLQIDLISSMDMKDGKKIAMGDRPLHRIMTHKKLQQLKKNMKQRLPPVFILNTERIHFELLKPLTFVDNWIPLDIKLENLFVTQQTVDGKLSASSSRTRSRTRNNEDMKALGSVKKLKVNAAGELTDLKQWRTVDRKKTETVRFTNVSRENPHVDGSVWITNRVDKEKRAKIQKEMEDAMKNPTFDWEGLQKVQDEQDKRKRRKRSKK